MVPEGAPYRIGDLETPCLVVDRARLNANLARVAGIASENGVALRPHVKTHKCLALAQRQLTLGAAGLTASKPDEARVFLEARPPSLTVAYPILDPRKLQRLMADGAQAGVELRFIVDSFELATALEAAARTSGRKAAVFLKVDVGLRRVGVNAEGPLALVLAQSLHSNRHLDFRGLLSHAGHAYGAPDREAIRLIARAESGILARLKRRLEASGVAVAEVSVGSTPTVLAADDFSGITEVRPGNYVFLDGTAVRLGIADRAEVAMRVRATVLSRNDDWLVVDAGSKVLSSDGGAHGAAASGFGEAFRGDNPEIVWPVGRLSEEHGWVAHRGSDVAVGEVLDIIPNHACPVANLVGSAWLVEGDEVVDRWEMEARARIL